MEIAVADPGGLHADLHLPGSGREHLDLLETEGFVGLIENGGESFHEG
jgi:hypothetical protein